MLGGSGKVIGRSELPANTSVTEIDAVDLFDGQPSSATLISLPVPPLLYYCCLPVSNIAHFLHDSFWWAYLVLRRQADFHRQQLRGGRVTVIYYRTALCSNWGQELFASVAAYHNWRVYHVPSAHDSALCTTRDAASESTKVGETALPSSPAEGNESDAPWRSSTPSLLLLSRPTSAEDRDLQSAGGKCRGSGGAECRAMFSDLRQASLDRCGVPKQQHQQEEEEEQKEDQHQRLSFPAVPYIDNSSSSSSSSSKRPCRVVIYTREMDACRRRLLGAERILLGPLRRKAREHNERLLGSIANATGPQAKAVSQHRLVCETIDILHSIPHNSCDQVALFNGASTILGIDGSWQTNIIFMEPSATVLAFQVNLQDDWPVKFGTASAIRHVSAPCIPKDSLRRKPVVNSSGSGGSCQEGLRNKAADYDTEANPGMVAVMWKMLLASDGWGPANQVGFPESLSIRFTKETRAGCSGPLGPPGEPAARTRIS